MEVTQTSLPGVLLLQPRRFGDQRGFFSESWNRNTLEAEGIFIDFVQDNHSMSDAAGTVRGLHFQTPPTAQAKLVRCGRGRLYDVAVDIRKGSPTYGNWVGYELSFENGKQLLIPEGFAHGFATLEPMTEIVYKCSDFYDPHTDSGIAWDSCGIDWGIDNAPILSDKDRALPDLAEFDSPFEWSGTP